MKISIFACLLISCLIAFGQDLRDFEAYIRSIEHSILPDTVRLRDTISGECVEVIGYGRNDTIFLADISFSQTPKKRTVYFRVTNYFPTNVCYIIESDMTSEEIILRTKLWDDKILESYQVEESQIRSIVYESDYMIALGCKIVDDRAQKYFLVGSLVEEIELPPGCGNFAFASGLKFVAKRTNFEPNSTYFVALLQCPRAYGEEFYEAGATYQMELATNSGVTFGWVVENQYKEENYPTLWIRKIEKFE